MVILNINHILNGDCFVIICFMSKYTFPVLAGTYLSFQYSFDGHCIILRTLMTITWSLSKEHGEAGLFPCLHQSVLKVYILVCIVCVGSDMDAGRKLSKQNENGKS